MAVPGSLTLGGHFVGVKVSAGLAAALVPAHVLAQVLLPDHLAVNRPLIARALIRQCSQSWRGDGVDVPSGVTGALMTLSVRRWLQHCWTVAAVATTHSVHALDHSGLQAPPT